jgi:[acyl-carrier-protein] S-malonyltransferase
MKKVAVLFAGQGAQTTGMGMNVLEQSPDLIPYFDSIQFGLNFNLKDILTTDDGRLNQTLYTQPALLSTSLLLYRQLQTLISFTPAIVAGFSLGEFTALHISGYFDLPTTLSLIQIRAQAMEEASRKTPGAMAAILGMDTDILKTLCQEVSSADGFVGIVNYNCPGQVVISGTVQAVDTVITKAPALGARRAIKLNVSGSFHSPLMHHASLVLAKTLPSLPLLNPTIPLIFNTTATTVALQDVKTTIAQQVQSPVLFQSSIEQMIAQGVDHFIEIGPGSVLSGFVRKINPAVKVVSYNGNQDIQAVKELLHE